MTEDIRKKLDDAQNALLDLDVRMQTQGKKIVYTDKVMNTELKINSNMIESLISLLYKITKGELK